MRKHFWLALAAGLILSAGLPAGASPLIRADHGAANAAAELVLIHHKPGHKMKHANRGRHLGWTRGKHKGWAKFR